MQVYSLNCSIAWRANFTWLIEAAHGEAPFLCQSVKAVELKKVTKEDAKLGRGALHQH